MRSGDGQGFPGQQNRPAAEVTDQLDDVRDDRSGVLERHEVDHWDGAGQQTDPPR